MVVLNIIVKYGFKICSADSETIRLFKDQHFEIFAKFCSFQDDSSAKSRNLSFPKFASSIFAKLGSRENVYH